MEKNQTQLNKPPTSNKTKTKAKNDRPFPQGSNGC
jgi:hypothetical protein